MKNITKYIYEKLKIQADNSSACVYAYNIDKFKSEEICKALDAIREYVNKNYVGTYRTTITMTITGV